jgi:hypothetical protein
MKYANLQEAFVAPAELLDEALAGYPMGQRFSFAQRAQSSTNPFSQTLFFCLLHNSPARSKSFRTNISDVSPGGVNVVKFHKPTVGFSSSVERSQGSHADTSKTCNAISTRVWAAIY